jgi:hypothetical protein
LDILYPVHELALTLLKASEIVQRFTHASIGQGPAHAAECCVIRLAGPRRLGHTTAAAKLAMSYRPTLYLAPTVAELAGFRNALTRAGGASDSVTVLSVLQLRQEPERLDMMLGGEKLTMVVVDHASQVPDDDQDWIIRQTFPHMAGQAYRYWVFLG